MIEIVLLVFSYLLGSVPFGFLTAHLVKGIDIRKHGSGNIGATNVFRVLGKNWGVFVFVLDFLKGVVPPLLMASLVLDCPNILIIAAAIFVICGHNWTVFLRFKGGKGVATSLGAVAGLSVIFPDLWWALLAAVASWVAAFWAFRYVSLASILSGAIFFILGLALSLPLEMKILALVLFVFILIRHKANIQRLVSGKEHRFK